MRRCFAHGLALIVLFGLCRVIGARPVEDVIGQEIARCQERMADPVAESRLEGIQGAEQLRLPVFEATLLPLHPPEPRLPGHRHIQDMSMACAVPEDTPM